MKPQENKPIRRTETSLFGHKDSIMDFFHFQSFRNPIDEYKENEISQISLDSEISKYAICPKKINPGCFPNKFFFNTSGNEVLNKNILQVHLNQNKILSTNSKRIYENENTDEDYLSQDQGIEIDFSFYLL